MEQEGFEEDELARMFLSPVSPVQGGMGLCLWHRI